MRGLMLVLALSSLGGCALWMPEPDPNQAWVDLKPHPASDLQAVEVDTAPLHDDRFFQVEPGNHLLGVRYRFEVSAANIGDDSEPLTRDCRLSLEYPAFAAGARYRLVAGRYGFRPWARLYDENDQLLARAVEKGCGGA